MLMSRMHEHDNFSTLNLKDGNSAPLVLQSNQKSRSPEISVYTEVLPVLRFLLITGPSEGWQKSGRPFDLELPAADLFRS